MSYQYFLNTENRVISIFQSNQIREPVAEPSFEPIQSHSLEQVLVPTPVLELSRETEKITYIYIYVCVCVCMYVCMCVCMYI